MNGKRVREVVMVLILLLAIPMLAAAQDTAWYINDGPDANYLWEDLSLGSFWEWMAEDAIEPGDLVCTYTDLLTGDFFQPYYATTAPMSVSYVERHFWAELYLDNGWTGFFESVTVTLGTGMAGNAASFTAVSAPITVTGITDTGSWECGQLVLFDFNILPLVTLNDSSLILKIEHPTDTGGVTHIFWDGECCPSALYVSGDTPATDRSWSGVKKSYR